MAERMKFAVWFCFSPFRVLIFFCIISSSFSIVSGDELAIFAGHPVTLKLSSGRPVESSPGAEPGALMVCERVYLYGLPRLQNLRKYAYSFKVSVNTTLNLQLKNVGLYGAEVHLAGRNTSIGIGMCPQGNWEKLVKGAWVRSMSLYENRLLDIRTIASSLEFLEVTTEEEYLLYRIIFLVLGISMMTLASTVSKSVTFYYSSAMVVGVILVILMVLFQGMKLLPTGRKRSLAIVMYGSVVGFGSILLRYLSGLLRSVLVEIGISEDIHNPLAIFLLVCIILSGSWLGFWGVRKIVLCEDGTVDISIARFVAWSIRIVAAVMIIQSSLDPLLAAEALILGIIFAVATRRVSKSRTVRHHFKHLFRKAKNTRRRSYTQNSPFKYSRAEFLHDVVEPESELFSPGIKSFRLASCNSPVIGTSVGLTKTSPGSSTGTETYYSTFHSTPEQRRFSKDDWEIFTRGSTRKALEELVSSPDFAKWAVSHAERITLTPPRGDTVEIRGRWFSRLFNRSV